MSYKFRRNLFSFIVLILGFVEELFNNGNIWFYMYRVKVQSFNYIEFYLKVLVMLFYDFFSERYRVNYMVNEKFNGRLEYEEKQGSKEKNLYLFL